MPLRYNIKRSFSIRKAYCNIMYLLPHKLPRFILLHHNHIHFFSFNVLPQICRPIQYTDHLHSRPSFSHMLLYCELVLGVVFRGTPRATSRVPQHTCLIMSSENVFLITFNYIFFIFLGDGFIFTANRELQNSVFHEHAQIFYFLKYKFIYENLFPLPRPKSALLLRAFQ